MPPKKKGGEKQGDFFNTLRVPVVVDETKGRKADGGHVEKNNPPQRTQHQIYIDSLTQPIVTRIKDGEPVVQGQG